MDWINWHSQSESLRDLSEIIHIPNGEKRSPRTGAMLKQMGVKPGVSDFFLPVPSRQYHGLWLELKARDGKLRDSQEEFINRMRRRGYCAIVAYGWEHASEILTKYLALRYLDLKSSDPNL